MIITEKVSIVLLFEQDFLIVNLQAVFFAKWYSSFLKLKSKSFLIYRFKKRGSQLIVHSHARTNNLEALLLEDQFMLIHVRVHS